MNLYLDDFSLL